MLLLLLFTEFVQRQLIQIHAVQVPGQHLGHRHILLLFYVGPRIQATFKAEHFNTLVRVSMVSDHSVTSSSQQVREESTQRRSSHNSLLI